MNNKLFLFALLAFILPVLCLPTAVRAADKSALLLPPTPSRSIAFFYYKLAKRMPDFDRIVQGESTYKNADPRERAGILSAQSGAMKTEFAGTDPASQLIIIRTAVQAKAVIAGKQPGLSITLPMTQGPIYFPYSWGGNTFAVIPDRMEAFLDIPMNIASATAANARITGGAATMVLELQPITADPKVMLLDGARQWLLMTKVVGVSYYNQYLQPIWTWHSPEFSRPEVSPLETLKK